MSNYRDELIQVAAVAVAAVECFDNGDTSRHEKTFNKIADEVYEERLRQEDKWKTQSHPPERWLTILHEETGEVARAILEGQV